MAFRQAGTGGRSAHLQILGLAQDAGWTEVQGRYRQLVLANHPDLHPADSGAAERFRAIAASYSALAALHREQADDPALCLRRICQDPRLRGLDQAELGQRLLYSSSPWVRAAAALLLGGQEPDRVSGGARRLLKAARRDPQAQVRRAAVESLACVGRPGDLAGYLLDRRRDLPAGLLLRSAAAIWVRAWRALFGRISAAIGVWP